VTVACAVVILIIKILSTRERRKWGWTKFVMHDLCTYFALHVMNGSGCPVDGTRLVTRCLDPVLTRDAIAQDCWYIRVRSYTRFTQSW